MPPTDRRAVPAIPPPWFMERLNRERMRADLPPPGSMVHVSGC
jgi:hypothetical protein